MNEPTVTRAYFENLAEQDEEGYYDYAYRCWLSWFDLDGRYYRVRIYVEKPDTADVLGTAGTRHPEHQDTTGLTP